MSRLGVSTALLETVLAAPKTYFSAQIQPLVPGNDMGTIRERRKVRNYTPVARNQPPAKDRRQNKLCCAGTVFGTCHGRGVYVRALYVFTKLHACAAEFYYYAPIFCACRLGE